MDFAAHDAVMFCVLVFVVGVRAPVDGVLVPDAEIKQEQRQKNLGDGLGRHGLFLASRRVVVVAVAVAVPVEVCGSPPRRPIGFVAFLRLVMRRFSSLCPSTERISASLDRPDTPLFLVSAIEYKYTQNYPFLCAHMSNIFWASSV